jgi:hypothetical protein
MQIATAAEASKELPLEGICSLHSAKCPAWKGFGLPAETYQEQLCQLAVWCQFWRSTQRDIVAEFLREVRFAGYSGGTGQAG